MTVAGPRSALAGVAGLHEAGSAAWPLAAARELDDAISRLRFDEPELGTWLLKTTGDPAARRALERALEYMDLRPGQALLGRKVDVVFIGSCTNGRISDLRLAAAVMKDRRVAPGVRMLVVPGSTEVKKQAEQEGLDRVFREAGADWREAGCSMCIAMNGDLAQPGQLVVSTSNRNFEGRQGKGGRTHLVSPITAAASAIAGHFVDVRENGVDLE